MTWLDMISPQVNIVWRGRNSPGWIEPLRRLYDHELVIVTDGQCRISIENKAVDCVPGTFIIVPPDKPHVTVAGPRANLYRFCIHFDWAYHPPGPAHGFCVFHPGRIKPALVHQPPGFVPEMLVSGQVRKRGEIEVLLKRIVACWTSRNASDRLLCRALLLEILIRLLSPLSDDQQSSPDSLRIAREARRLLDSPISQHESIQRVLESLGYSYAHVCRLFRKAYGTRPLQYVKAARVQGAKALLQEGRPVADAARQAGFNDPAYFARVFKAHTSMSPRRFQEISLRHTEK